MATPPWSDLADAPPDDARVSLQKFLTLPDAPRAELVDGVFERVPLGGPLHARTFVPLAPDLAVETLSPSERTGKIQRKVEEYLEHGTELVWLADPQRRTAAVYTRGRVRWLHEGDALGGGDVVPGFSVPLAFLFEDLAPPT